MSEVTGKADPVTVIVRPKAGELEVAADRDLMLSFLDGEVDCYTLRLKNVGHAPVSQVQMQTDYPIVFGWKNIAFDWTLNPGEQRELQIHVRAKLIQSRDELNPRILIRYCANVEQLHYRYKRIEHRFAVHKSLHIRENWKNSSTDLNEYLVNLQIGKLHVPNKWFGIKQLCVVGREWRIEEKKQFKAFNKVFNSYFSLVHNKEGVELKEKQVVYGDNEVEGDVTVMVPYVNYIREYEDFMQIKDKECGSSIIIAVLWSLEMEVRKVNGFDLVSISIGENSDERNDIRKIDSFPLQIVYECPTSIEHNFEHEPLCKVSLTLFIKNISCAPVSFRFEGTRGQPERKDNSSNFLWEGSATKNFSDVPSQGQCEVSIKGCMMSSGIYNLNRFTFTFFIDSDTGKSIDPAGEIPQKMIVKTHELEFEQILVNIKDAA
eukprot:TRINITY_DN16007_c0_g1_i20.p1 TRINITY_DN16007_c0_g1~~TRINITY_DN16007_c0_g1_i20.p1  ORF type:complete len:433 (+),score=112.02 TRINITY_DN16007_c0_g1_i20:789-2087(+)